MNILRLAVLDVKLWFKEDDDSHTQTTSNIHLNSFIRGGKTFAKCRLL